MNINNVIKSGLIVFISCLLVSGLSYANVNMTFSAPYVSGIAKNLANKTGAVTNGMIFGIIIDTEGDGIVPSTTDFYDHVSITTAGITTTLSVNGIPTDDVLHVPSVNNVTLNNYNVSEPEEPFVSDSVSKGGDGGIIGVDNVPFYSRKKFFIVWFDGHKGGVLGDGNFETPAGDGVVVDGATNSGEYGKPFLGSDPVRTAGLAYYGASGISTGAGIQFAAAPEENSVSTLSDLELSAGGIDPVFGSNTLNYSVSSVPNNVTTTTVTPTATAAAAAVRVNGVMVNSGQPSAEIPLTVGINTIRVVVTAQDGATTKTYTVIVTRAASTVATLRSLNLSTGALTPAFAPATTAYTRAVANTVTSATVIPTVTHPRATVRVNGILVASGSASAAIPLTIGANTIIVVVTAQDGDTKKTYTVTVTRAASAVATLRSLNLSAGALTPTFASATTAYTRGVGNAVTSVTVTPTVTHPRATVRVNGALVASGSASAAIPLSVGTNTIRVVVTAQDGVTKKTYTVAVTRAASTVATLRALKLSAGILAPEFSSGTITYASIVANPVTSIKITPTTAQANATVKVNGASVVSGSASAPISLIVGINTIQVEVTAQNGTAKRTYTISVTRKPSSNAYLKQLTLKSGVLSPEFTRSRLNYYATVPASLAAIRIQATTDHSKAMITVNGTKLASGVTSNPIPLNAGKTVISIVVTAQDGNRKIYSITITKSL